MARGPDQFEVAIRLDGAPGADVMGARLKRFRACVRSRGIANLPPLHVYAAQGAYSCIRKALQVMGHGEAALTSVPLAEGRMDIAVLEDALQRDRAAGPANCALDSGPNANQRIAESRNHCACSFRASCRARLMSSCM